ncbi:MAG: dephospho-CoA kinase [Rubrobacteridae bacterium]|nr:dephospho-CoA kinase [Rubrobacteridae bacterium]
MLYNLTMKVIGITGAIASGKSTVAKLFEKKGALLLDADIIARDVARKGSSAYSEIVAYFGEDILDHDKEVDRKKLARIVFKEPAKLEVLNEIIHPKVEKEIELKISEFKTKRTDSRIVVLDVPLLFEAGLEKYCDVLIVVRAGIEQRLERLIRKGMTAEDAEKRIRAQKNKDKLECKADIVIENGAEIKDLENIVDGIWNELVRP